MEIISNSEKRIMFTNPITVSLKFSDLNKIVKDKLINLTTKSAKSSDSKKKERLLNLMPPKKHL